ncbi:MAG: hypothetical protein R2762_22910, partial [Bryobacteraceae bacterium]
MSVGHVDHIVNPDQKREALEAVLHSRTFDRSDQLKAFLRFVCEAEIAGQSEQLHEYQIGVDALGRPPGYSPAEDAIVRNRAYALRRKLEEYYSLENPGAAVRIEVPRGGYVPRYLPQGAAAPQAPAFAAPAAVAAENKGRRWVWFLAGAAASASVA